MVDRVTISLPANYRIFPSASILEFLFLGALTKTTAAPRHSFLPNFHVELKLIFFVRAGDFTCLFILAFTMTEAHCEPLFNLLTSIK